MDAAAKARLNSTPDEIEAQFYQALREGQVDRVMSVWSPDDDLVCVHPSGACSVGWAAVREAYQRLLAAGPLRIHAEQVQRVRSGTVAVHSVSERIEVNAAGEPKSVWAIATNVYVYLPQGWRLLAHHASSASADGNARHQDGSTSPPPPRVHRLH